MPLSGAPIARASHISCSLRTPVTSSLSSSWSGNSLRAGIRSHLCIHSTYIVRSPLAVVWGTKCRVLGQKQISEEPTEVVWAGRGGGLKRLVAAGVGEGARFN